MSEPSIAELLRLVFPLSDKPLSPLSRGEICRQAAEHIERLERELAAAQTQIAALEREVAMAAYKK